MNTLLYAQASSNDLGSCLLSMAAFVILFFGVLLVGEAWEKRKKKRQKNESKTP